MPFRPLPKPVGLCTRTPTAVARFWTHRTILVNTLYSRRSNHAKVATVSQNDRFTLTTPAWLRGKQRRAQIKCPGPFSRPMYERTPCTRRKLDNTPHAQEHTLPPWPDATHTRKAKRSTFMRKGGAPIMQVQSWSTPEQARPRLRPRPVVRARLDAAQQQRSRA